MAARDHGQYSGITRALELVGIRRIISGELAPDRASATGVVQVLRWRGDLGPAGRRPQVTGRRAPGHRSQCPALSA
jgi:hypothetical protein